MLFRFAKRFFQKKRIPLVLSLRSPDFPGLSTLKKLSTGQMLKGGLE
ncbi:hypothetical protein SZ54_0611 [Rhizobium sp. UR51a]|jgi:hypothetical protein|nr:hypothetical protein SZ54_0611 [Rhizobium sp. UR51a]